MANIMFSKGFVQNLPAQAEEGRLYFTLDESIYLGLADGSFHRYGDFIEVDNVASLPTDGAHVKALYYCKAENVLAKWDGSAWVQINKDTDTTYVISAGATAGSIKLTGKDKSGKQVSEVDVQIADVAAIEASIKEAKDAADAAQADVDALAEKVGTVAEGETVMGEIGEIKEALEALTGDAEGSIADVIDAKIAELDVTDAEVEGQFVVAVSETDGKVAPIRRALKESDIPEIGQGKVTGLEDALNGKADKATTLAGYGITDAMTATEIADAIKVEKDRAEAAELAINNKIGSVTEGKTVVEMIADAKSEATYDDSALTERVKANEDAISVLNGSGEGSVDKKITDAFNDFSTKVTDDAVVNSYKELIDWAAEHGSDAAEMATAITAMQNILDGIGGEGESATVVAYVQAAVDALKIGDYATVEALNAAIERIAANEAAIAGLGDLAGKDKVAEADLEETLAGKIHTHTFNEAELNKVAEGDVAKWNSAQANAEAKAAELDAAMKSELQGEISGVDAKFANYTDTTGMNSAIATAKGEAVQAATDMNTAMDNRVKVLEGINHDAYVGADETNLQAAKDYADEAVNAAFVWQTF